jgi:hypothetical protein
MRFTLLKILVGTIIGLVFYLPSKAQIRDTMGVYDTYVLQAVEFNGDTIGSAKIEEIVIFPKVKFNNKREYRRYKKLIRDLKKVYPYAQKAKYKLI